MYVILKISQGVSRTLNRITSGSAQIYKKFICVINVWIIFTSLFVYFLYGEASWTRVAELPQPGRKFKFDTSQSRTKCSERLSIHNQKHRKLTNGSWNHRNSKIGEEVWQTLIGSDISLHIKGAAKDGLHNRQHRRIKRTCLNKLVLRIWGIHEDRTKYWYVQWHMWQPDQSKGEMIFSSAQPGSNAWSQVLQIGLLSSSEWTILPNNLGIIVTIIITLWPSDEESPMGKW